VPNKDYFLHKIGYETDFQPIINRYSLADWKDLLEKNGCRIIKTIRDNYHLSIYESGSWLKLLMKIIAHPFVELLPIKWSFGFIFICSPDKMQK